MMREGKNQGSGFWSSFSCRLKLLIFSLPWVLNLLTEGIRTSAKSSASLAKHGILGEQTYRTVYEALEGADVLDYAYSC